VDKIIKQIMMFFMIAVLLFTICSPPVLAQGKSGDDDKEKGAGPMMFDLLLIRPVGVAATVIGSALFVVSLPFSAIGGNTKPAYEKMVKEPAKYTFTRPLGDY